MNDARTQAVSTDDCKQILPIEVALLVPNVDEGLKLTHQLMECNIKVFGPLADEHKELKEIYSDYKKRTEKHIQDMDDCMKEGSDDLKMQ